jgi:hypothetical protein
MCVDLFLLLLQKNIFSIEAIQAIFNRRSIACHISQIGKIV